MRYKTDEAFEQFRSRLICMEKVEAFRLVFGEGADASKE
jgi:hypothetical protein